MGYSVQKCDEWRTISILLTQERNNNPILFRTFAAVKVTDKIWASTRFLFLQHAYIQAFGRRFAMTRQAAFRYLHEHKGLAFLIEFYDVEHLQSMDETIDDLLIICQKNGGTLA